MRSDRLISFTARCLILVTCGVMWCSMAAPVAAQQDDHADATLEHPIEEALEGPAGDMREAYDDPLDAEGEHVDYNRPPLTPHIPLLVWSLVVFGLFLLAARKLAWTPLIRGLDSREARVNRALAEAEQARIDATKLLADHKAHLDRVTEEVQAIIAKARTDAEHEKLRIISEAEVEATALRDQAIADIHAAREEALAGLDERIDAQVELASRHVLG
jgi:F-type H+-transporting ATPase subunit b